MHLSHATLDDSSRCPPDVCVGAVLGDALHRVSVLGGREGMSRSLGSVYGGSITRFLGGGLRGVRRRTIKTSPARPKWSGVAVSRDGSTLLVSDTLGVSHAIHEFCVLDGSRRRAIGSKGSEPLQFNSPRQVWIASDDFVFVADCNNNRVQVLTPHLDFHCFIGVGELHRPAGVCANDSVVVVSEHAGNRISVFNRGDGTVLRRFGSQGPGGGQLQLPRALCFMSSNSHVAVADGSNSRVSVFSVDGELIRHVGVGKLSLPAGVACSASDELVVTDHKCVTVFSGSGEVLKTMGRGEFRGVAIHGGAIFAQHYSGAKCIIFK